ncbi:MAG: family hydrolase [Chloroflexi bacterium]|nr:family hydrolase [Chloroflexota bacterium]
MTRRPELAGVPEPLAGIRAITFDFGNTLVRVSRGALHGVLIRTAAEVAATLRLGDPAGFRTAWAQERERQFREEVPEYREVDLHQRSVRVLARLRGMRVPGPEVRWDDVAAGGLATAEEVGTIVDAYSQAFVESIPQIEGVAEVLAGLAGRGFRLAILSNWPLAETVDRYAAAAGWGRYLSAIFVSQRIGTIKPHPAIFAVAAEGLGMPPDAILHVGDDWAADVIGARDAGWRVAYLRDHQADSPLPSSPRTDGVEPDLELDRLADLPSRVADPTP